MGPVLDWSFKKMPVKQRIRATGLAVESRALAKGLQLIDILTAAKTPLPLNELASLIGLGKASALRLLRTLMAMGYAAQDAAGNYEAKRHASASASARWLDRLVQAADSEMRRLNEDLAETVSLAALFEDHIRVVHSIESPRQIRMSNYSNRILAPYASSLGKAIAAGQTPERLQMLLQVYGIYQTTPKTITEPLQIRAEMERTRQRGYSFEYEETVPGGCCFGAPISLPGEPACAAISVSLPIFRFNKGLEKTIPSVLMQAARQISRRLSQLRAR